MRYGCTHDITETRHDLPVHVNVTEVDNRFVVSFIPTTSSSGPSIISGGAKRGFPIISGIDYQFGCVQNSPSMDKEWETSGVNGTVCPPGDCGSTSTNAHV